MDPIEEMRSRREARKRAFTKEVSSETLDSYIAARKEVSSDMVDGIRYRDGPITSGYGTPVETSIDDLDFLAVESKRGGESIGRRRSSSSLPDYLPRSDSLLSAQPIELPFGYRSLKEGKSKSALYPSDTDSDGKKSRKKDKKKDKKKRKKKRKKSREEEEAAIQSSEFVRVDTDLMSDEMLFDRMSNCVTPVAVAYSEIGSHNVKSRSGGKLRGLRGDNSSSSSLGSFLVGSFVGGNPENEANKEVDEAESMASSEEVSPGTSLLSPSFATAEDMKLSLSMSTFNMSMIMSSQAIPLASSRHPGDVVAKEAEPIPWTLLQIIRRAILSESDTVVFSNLSSFPVSCSDLNLLVDVRAVKFVQCNLTKLPKEITSLRRLESLEVSGNPVSAIYNWSRLDQLPHLTSLTLSSCVLGEALKSILEQLPESITELNLDDVGIMEFPSNIEFLTNITTLRISRCALTYLPQEIMQLPLKVLKLSRMDITSLPPNILGSLGLLQELDISFCKISTFPSLKDVQPNLVELHISGNPLEKASGISKMSNLARFYAECMPNSFDFAPLLKCSKLVYVDISGYGGSKLPSFVQHSKHLETLIAKRSKRVVLPKSFSKALESLAELDLMGSVLDRRLSLVLGLERLRVLRVTLGLPMVVPHAIGEMTQLEEVEVSYMSGDGSSFNLFPSQIQSTEDRLSFLRLSDKGVEYMGRVFFVGARGSGKTTVKHMMMGKTKAASRKAGRSVFTYDDRPAYGITVENGISVSVRFVEISGDSHIQSLIVGDNAVYTLVWNPIQPEGDALVYMWISMLQGKDAKFIIVITHVDMMEKLNIDVKDATRHIIHVAQGCSGYLGYKLLPDRSERAVKELKQSYQQVFSTLTNTVVMPSSCVTVKSCIAKGQGREGLYAVSERYAGETFCGHIPREVDWKLALKIVADDMRMVHLPAKGVLPGYLILDPEFVRLVFAEWQGLCSEASQGLLSLKLVAKAQWEGMKDRMDDPIVRPALAKAIGSLASLIHEVDAPAFKGFLMPSALPEKVPKAVKEQYKVFRGYGRVFGRFYTVTSPYVEIIKALLFVLKIPNVNVDSWRSGFLISVPDKGYVVLTLMEPMELCLRGFMQEEGRFREFECVHAFLDASAMTCRIGCPQCLAGTAVQVVHSCYIPPADVFQRFEMNKMVKCALCESAWNPETLLPDMLDAKYVGHVFRVREIQCLEEIGRGGYGTVYEGKWRRKEVAVKEVENVRELMREVFVHRKLQHKSIVEFLGLGLRPFSIVMVRCKVSLLELIKGALLGLREKLLYAEQVAAAVAYMHGRMPPVVHGDIKLGNVLLTMSEEEVKLVDFGTCRFVGSKVAANNPLYMAPELIRGGGASLESDIYSLGILIYELVTQVLYFSDIPFLSQVEDMVLAGERPDISKLDNRLAKLISGCWSADPEARPTAAQVILQLAEIRAGAVGEAVIG